MTRHLEHGVLRLLEDLHLVGIPDHGNSSHLHLNDGPHIPVRWKVLLHARDVEGLTWVECGRLLGISGPAAIMAYRTWKPRQCCPHEPAPADAPAPSASSD